MEHIIISILIQTARKTARRDAGSGEWVLVYGWIWRFLHLVGTVLFIAAAVVLFVNGAPGKRGVHFLGGFMAACAILGVYCMIETSGTSIRLGDRDRKSTRLNSSHVK